MRVSIFPKTLNAYQETFPQTVDEAVTFAAPAMRDRLCEEISLTLFDEMYFENDESVQQHDVILSRWAFRRYGEQWTLTEARALGGKSGCQDFKQMLHAFRETLKAHSYQGFERIRLLDARDTVNISYLFEAPLHAGETLKAWVAGELFDEFRDIATLTGYDILT